jgi:hypothetical protein
MSQGLKYADAVKLLGGASPAVKAMDDLLGGALAVATGGGSELALGLFDAKAEVIRLGHVVAGKLHETVRGLGRYDRSSRLQAAHGILVVTSFFDALDEIIEATELESPQLTRADQVMLAAGTRLDGEWLFVLFHTDLPAPSPETSYQALLTLLRRHYTAMSLEFGRYLEGLAVWDRSTERDHRQVHELLTGRLPDLAVRRYEEMHRRLAVDVPEFAIWARHAEAGAVGHSLSQLHELLLEATSGQDPERHRAALAAAYQADLHLPVARGDAAADLGVPTLGEAYLDARFRARAAGPGARPAEDGWWSTEIRTDLAAFLAGYLTTPQAADAPLLLLGQPGAGKSALTRVLAARLPAADFLVVRVPLREVPAEAEVQDQVELAVRTAIGETVAWADLARSAGTAMPVILLDGFDELLQATGIHQSDYLQRVAAFQHREAVQGRPVAVIVTSRVAVADRARIPAGSLAVRLEGFDRQQVAGWLLAWNTANLGRPGHRRLTVDLVGQFPDFCEQPLLLLMLALYDANTHALQEDASFDTVQLYERLLSSFAEREVRRMHDGGREQQVPALVEAELVRLSVVAFAMFNRLRQWVTERELDADLAGLGLAPIGTGRTEAFRSPLTAGEELVGRFFFIQRAQALSEGRTLQTYEFLHATFGEYLVARLVVRAVRDNAARAAAGTLTLGAGGRDDALLQSLLGFTPLAARGTVLPFVRSMLAGPDRDRIREWLMDALRTAMTRPEYSPRQYRPVEKRSDFWMALYQLNLTLLALACGEPVRASEMFRYAKDPAAWLRGAARQWTAAVPSGIWAELVATLAIFRTWDGERRDILIELGPAPRTGVDPLWSLHPHDPGPEAIWVDESADQVANRLQLTGDTGEDLLRHATEPLAWWIPTAFTTVVVHEGVAGSVAHTLTELWVQSAQRSDPRRLTAAYARAVHTVFAAGLDARGSQVDAGRAARLVLTTLSRDAGRLRPDHVLSWLNAAVESSYFRRSVAAVFECLAAMQAPPGTPILPLVTKMNLDRLTLEPIDVVRVLAVLPELQDLMPAEAMSDLRAKFPADPLADPEVLKLLETDRTLAARLKHAATSAGRGPRT